MSLFFNFFSVSFSDSKSVHDDLWAKYILLFHLLSCKVRGMSVADLDTTSMRLCFPLAQSPFSAGCSFASPDTDCIKDRKILSLCTAQHRGGKPYLGPQRVPSPETVLSGLRAQALFSRATVLKHSNKYINKDSQSFLQYPGFSHCKDNEL